MKKHKEKLDEGKIKLVTFVTFLMGFAQAMLIYVMSTYFKLSIGTENVGIFYAVSYIIFLVILLNLHKFVRILGKSNIFYFSLFAKLIVIFGLILVEPSKLGILLMILYIILGHIEWVALDFIIEEVSTDRMSGRIRGMHLTILNAGFLFGPFVSTYFLDKINFHGVFIFALIFNIFVFIFALIGFRKVNKRFEQKLKVLDILKKVLARKNIMRIYYISFVLEFFYALMVIYTPIYLRDLGFSWEDIGIIFTIMLIPFVIFQYPAGLLADKKMGEKELLFFSILIMGISTMLIYFMGTGSVVKWALILFVTRIGASLIEILRDSYFYKRIDCRDVDVIDFFRTSLPTAYIFATIFSSFVFLFLPIKFVFVLTGLIVLSALYPAFRLADNRSEKEMGKC
ncbi:MAG: MFS transporter [bacterium]|nr:MFS transporter [bacterium]